jgi:hypothetical protein
MQRYVLKKWSERPEEPSSPNLQLKKLSVVAIERNRGVSCVDNGTLAQCLDARVLATADSEDVCVSIDAIALSCEGACKLIDVSKSEGFAASNFCQLLVVQFDFVMHCKLVSYSSSCFECAYANLCVGCSIDECSSTVKWRKVKVRLRFGDDCGCLV